MKTVFSPEQVAHVWAHQTQNEGRNAGGTFYFNRNVIYSYGEHFPICAIHNGTALMTERGYSNTTARHIAHVRRAIFQPIVWCDTPVKYSTDFQGHAENLMSYYQQVKLALQSLENKRIRPQTIERLQMDARRAISNAGDYIGLFQLTPRKISKNRSFLTKPERERINQVFRWVAGESLNLSKIVKKETSAEKRQAKEWAKRQAEEHKMRLSDLEQWKNGVDTIYNENGTTRRQTKYGARELDTIGLRVNGDLIETSKGAEVELKHAEIFYKRYVKTCQDVAGVHCGPFVAKSLECGKNLVIGCHDIPMSEVNRIALQLGW